MAILQLLRHVADSQLEIDPERVCRWIVALTNQERGRHGVLPLQRLSKLDRVAAFHSANMVRMHFFAHQDPEKRGPQERLQLIHPELLGAAGENIAMVPAEPEEQVARSLMEGWMNSPGHRRNLLASFYSHVGIGLCQSGRCVYATQSFASLYVELLHRHLPVSLHLGETCILRFYFFGVFDRSDLAMLLELPHPSAMMPIGNGRYFKGACPQNLMWESGHTFQLSVTLSCGRGSYKLRPGVASLGEYCPVALPVEVR